MNKMFSKSFSNLDEALNFSNKFSLADIFTNGSFYFVVPISEWAEDTEARFMFEDKAIKYRESLEESRKPAFDEWLATLPYAMIGSDEVYKKVYTSLGVPTEAKLFLMINNYWKEVNKNE